MGIKLRYIILLGVSLLIVGCKKFDNSQEYQNAVPHGRTIVLPSDLKGTTDELYVIPKTPSRDGFSGNAEPLPPILKKLN